MSDDKKIKVVLLEPSKLARAVEIDASLEGMQKTVGGLIDDIDRHYAEIMKGHEAELIASEPAV